MKILRLILLLLFFLLSSVHAQNVWYVDPTRSGAGTYDGRSWATAWQNTDSLGVDTRGINWYVIQSGDTIYFSGGTDSATYRGVKYFRCRPTWPPSEHHSFYPPVILRPAKYSGRTDGEWANHIGDVYFVNSDTMLDRNVSISISGLDFKDFYFITNAVTNSRGGGVFNVVSEYFTQEDGRLTFDSCVFINDSTGFPSSLMGSYHTVINSLIRTSPNKATINQEPMTLGWGGKGGHKFIGNTIINNCAVDSTDDHPDFIQLGGAYGDDDYLETLFLNNLMIQLTPSRKSWYNAGIYISSGPFTHKQRFTWINNIMVMQLPDSNHFGAPNAVPAIWMRGGEFVQNGKYSLRLFNNTIIYPSSSLLLSQGDSIYTRNNAFIFANPGVTNGGVFSYNEGAFKYINMDYNFYYSPNWNVINQWRGSVWRNYSQWKALQGIGIYVKTDHNSDTSYVNPFVYSSDINDYMTPELLRGKGENLSHLADDYPEIMYDILGNPRPITGAWDIGALQFQGAPSVNVQGKIFLQGPFITNSMYSNLSQNSLLPASQPYNTAPWNYNGNEVLSLPAGQAGSVVDWVLVELRNSSNPQQIVGRRSAMLRNDGILLEPNGNVGVRFENLQEGSYFIAVFHRNHLAVMSAAPVPLSSNSQLYDFTNAMSKAYGTNPMKDLGNGIFGMYAGDGDSNGGITIGDRVEVWQLQNGTMGYLKGDFNLDGGVNIIDANMFWSPNNGLMSQVP